MTGIQRPIVLTSVLSPSQLEDLEERIRVARHLFEAVDVNEAVEQLWHLLYPTDAEAKSPRRRISHSRHSRDVLVPMEERHPPLMFSASMREAIPHIPERMLPTSKKKRIIIRKKKKKKPQRQPTSTESTNNVSNPVNESDSSVHPTSLSSEEEGDNTAPSPHPRRNSSSKAFPNGAAE